MGVDIHVHVLKYEEKDNLYHEKKLFVYDASKDIYDNISPWSGRNYELFRILNDDGDFPASSYVNLNSLDDNSKEEIKEDIEFCYGFHEILLVELKLYLIEHPTIEDFEEDWEEGTEVPTKENPVKEFYTAICNYLNFADWTFDFTSLSKYKVVYYFDH